jgi:hypothetical protein
VKLEFIGPGGDKDTLSAKSADEVLDDALVRRKRIRSIRVRGSNYDVKPPRTARLLIDTPGSLQSTYRQRPTTTVAPCSRANSIAFLSLIGRAMPFYIRARGCCSA